MSASTPTTGSTFRFDTSALTMSHWVVVVLAALSGIIHLYLYSTEQYLPFLLAGLGFLGAIALLIVLPDYRKFLYPVGVLFVLAQLVGYVMIGTAFDTPFWLEALDKAAQVIIIAVLARMAYEEWR